MDPGLNENGESIFPLTSVNGIPSRSNATIQNEKLASVFMAKKSVFPQTHYPRH
jgi:hypothetical protein